MDRVGSICRSLSGTGGRSQQTSTVVLVITYKSPTDHVSGCFTGKPVLAGSFLDSHSPVILNILTGCGCGRGVAVVCRGRSMAVYTVVVAVIVVTALSDSQVH